MATKRFQRKKPYRLPEQLFAIKSGYPDSACYIRHSKLFWSGNICPSPLSQTYKVDMRYKVGRRPVVIISGENLKRLNDPNFPHNYHIDIEKKSVEICLHLPTEFTSHMLLADAIIPWTIEWLYHYEVWLATGEWLGGGKHPNIKVEQNR